MIGKTPEVKNRLRLLCSKPHLGAMLELARVV